MAAAGSAVPRRLSGGGAVERPVDAGRPAYRLSADGQSRGGRRRTRHAASLPPQAELADALVRARSEAAGAFGSDELDPRDKRSPTRAISKFQVFADQHGDIIHLGERDCSIQRRHQKVIEEAPSPAIGAELRGTHGRGGGRRRARCWLMWAPARSNFCSTHRVNFYFLEMNTRLQVEHAVTEAITGIDLVEWQLRIAAGEPLPLQQNDDPIPRPRHRSAALCRRPVRGLHAAERHAR